MLSTQSLEVVAGVAALLIGPVLVFAAPRLVADRLEDPPEPPGPGLLIPLVGGWVVQRDRWRAPIFELVLVAIFVGLAANYESSIRLLLACAFCALLLLIAYIDLEHRLVLNRLSYPGIALSLAVSLFWPGMGMLNATLGALAGFAIFLCLQLIGRGALGMGDTKLATLIGAMRGLPIVLNALLFGVLLGGLGGVFYLFILRRGRKEYMPYGPYLAVGAILSFFLIPN